MHQEVKSSKQRGAEECHHLETQWKLSVYRRHGGGQLTLFHLVIKKPLSLYILQNIGLRLKAQNTVSEKNKTGLLLLLYFAITKTLETLKSQ